MRWWLVDMSRHTPYKAAPPTIAPSFKIYYSNRNSISSIWTTQSTYLYSLIDLLILPLIPLLVLVLWRLYQCPVLPIFKPSVPHPQPLFSIQNQPTLPPIKIEDAFLNSHSICFQFTFNIATTSRCTALCNKYRLGHYEYLVATQKKGRHNLQWRWSGSLAWSVGTREGCQNDAADLQLRYRPHWHSFNSMPPAVFLLIAFLTQKTGGCHLSTIYGSICAWE